MFLGVEFFSYCLQAWRMMLIIRELSLILFSIKGTYIFNILSQFENHLKIESKTSWKIKWEFIPLISSWKCSWKTDWVLPRLCKKLGLESYSIFSDYAHFLPFLVISCHTGKRRRSVLWHLLTLGPDYCCGLRAPLKPLLGPEHPQNVISIFPWETITTVMRKQ